MIRVLAHVDRLLIVRPASSLCLMMATVALSSAAVGALVNYMLAEIMAVGGMVAIGLLFLGLAWFHRLDEPLTAFSNGRQNHDQQAAVWAATGRNGRWAPGLSPETTSSATSVPFANDANQPGDQPVAG